MKNSFTRLRKIGAPRKYDWDALVDPGYFLLEAASLEDAKKKQRYVLSSHNNNPNLPGKIKTSVGETLIRGRQTHCVLVERKSNV